MNHQGVATVDAGSPTQVSPAQARVIAAALDLFARHGVGGTSLQMIADEIGVTKAAVYHQYRTKDEIVLAAAESELRGLEAVVAVAESESSPKRARGSLISGIVELAVDRGRNASTILSDPVIIGFFADHEGFRDVMLRLRHILVGDDAGAQARVRTAMLIAAVSGAVMHPFLADMDDDVVRVELLRLARSFLDLPA